MNYEGTKVRWLYPAKKHALGKWFFRENRFMVNNVQQVLLNKNFHPCLCLTVVSSPLFSAWPVTFFFEEGFYQQCLITMLIFFKIQLVRIILFISHFLQYLLGKVIFYNSYDQINIRVSATSRRSHSTNCIRTKNETPKQWQTTNCTYCVHRKLELIISPCVQLSLTIFL